MPAERMAMRHVREALRLKFVGGVPTREIARRIGVAASTVRATIKRFQAAGLSWPLPEELTDAALEARLFPDAGTKQGHRRQVEPDWASIHRELNRPGGHVTGISLLSNVLGAKRIALLHEVAPRVSRIALLMNPTNPNRAAEQTDAEAGAKSLGIETVVLNARNAAEIDAAFEELLRAKAGGFMAATDPIPLDRREQIVAFAQKHSLPAVYFVRQFATAGGLLSYGPSISWMYRQAGAYVAQILKDANPAEMPVLQPTTFEFVLNLKAAKALGLVVPQTLLVAADEVIE
jgi:ABC-type uncharacterized transport system substrate-binding protein